MYENSYAFDRIYFFRYILTSRSKNLSSYSKSSFGGAPDEARIAAIAKAKREVIEKAGTYLESLTVVQNGSVTKDEVISIAAGVLRVEIVSQENYVIEDAFGIKVVSKVDVDLSFLEIRVSQLIDNKCVFEEYQNIERQNRKLLSLIQELENENQRLKSLLKTDKNIKISEIKTNFKKATTLLSSDDWYKKAKDLWCERKYNVNSDAVLAIEYLSRSLGLNHENPYAYNLRGLAYKALRKYEKAIFDLNKAISVDPDLAVAYYNRGLIFYVHNKKPKEAIADYDKSIELNPNFHGAYYDRGIAHSALKEYDKIGDIEQAEDDFKKAIGLYPKFAETYEKRKKKQKPCFISAIL